MRALLAALTVCASLVAPSARAYVRAVSFRGTPLRWPGSCVVFFPDAAGSTRVSGDAAFAALQAAANTWSAVPGAYIEVLVASPALDLEPWVSRDGPNQNIIRFEEREWPYDIYAVAITFITYHHDRDPEKDGVILDADILLNAEEYGFGVSGHPARHDIQAVVTHELGHALGLDHLCDDGAVTPTPVDHTGTPIPSCDSTLSATLLEATMYNRIERGETKKRTLAPDDIAGLEAIYPQGDDPRQCTDATAILEALARDREPGGCHCHSASPGDSGAVPLFWLLAWLLVRRRRFP